MSLALWLLLTGLLALYVVKSASFGSTYGPLTGIFALLLWANLSSVALFLGVAFAAQLEAVRAGTPTPASADPLTVGRGQTRQRRLWRCRQPLRGRSEPDAGLVPTHKIDRPH